MKFAKFLLAVAVAVFSSVFLLASPGFTCGGDGPCAGTQAGTHGHAYLTVYDSTTGHQIEVPKGIGLMRYTLLESRKETFCYLAIHTHDAAGILHLAVHEDNNMALASFMNLWNSEVIKKAKVKKVLVNGMKAVSVEVVVVQREMDIKIFLASEKNEDGKEENHAHAHDHGDHKH